MRNITSNERIALEFIFAYTRKENNSKFNKKVKQSFESITVEWIDDSIFDSLLNKKLIEEVEPDNFSNGLGYKLTNLGVSLLRKGYSLDFYVPKDNSQVRKHINLLIAHLCSEDPDYLETLAKKINNLPADLWAKEK